ncbi:hypothetical protein AMTR_s00060p00103120 [Amborella trichopoda]|uniref:Uncharacterized protein n=1 Tax=Amborella trichopoda TaxID=13333 RepID=W1NKW5_AMBTC|nr:hypothetical protein AMTR_s00060p00103120 [Amborella trichopoda]
MPPRGKRSCANKPSVCYVDSKTRTLGLALSHEFVGAAALISTLGQPRNRATNGPCSQARTGRPSKKRWIRATNCGLRVGLGPMPAWPMPAQAQALPIATLIWKGLAHRNLPTFILCPKTGILVHTKFVTFLKDYRSETSME